MDTLENGGDLVGSAVEVVGKKMRTKNYWNRTPFPDGFWLAQATASFYFMAFFLVIGAASLSTVAIREMIEARREERLAAKRRAENPDEAET